MKTSNRLVVPLACVALGCGSADETARASASSGLPPGPTCDAAGARGIAIAATDVYGGVPYALGYPPYAIDGCTLVYVARPDTGTNSGPLVVRDLTTARDAVLAPAAELPGRPAIAGQLVAWEATLGGTRVVRVRAPGSDPVTVLGSFDHAGEPRVAEDVVVFTAWRTPDDAGDTDVFMYVPSTGKTTAVATGPGQQRFADISARYVAWSDFSEDPDGTFNDDGTDLADVVVLDRASGIATPWPRPGKQAFPMVAGDRLGFLNWSAVHPEPKFGEYDLRVSAIATGATGGDTLVEHVVTQAPYIRPAAHDAIVQWVSWPVGGTAELRQRPMDLSAAAERVNGLDGLELYGPALTSRITVLAGRSPGGAMILEAVDQ